MRNLSDTATATVRTSVNMTVLTVIVWLVNHLTDYDLTVDNMLPWGIPVVAAAVGVFYRLSRAIADKWPVVGRVLFGINKTPAYTPPAS